MYKPLPYYLTIKPSKIEGLGLFVTENIPIETNLGISHYYILDQLIRTPLGGFYNHSDMDSNCYTEAHVDCVHLITKRMIVAGEELTAFYKIQPLSTHSSIG